jgi:hypothetical protein
MVNRHDAVAAKDGMDKLQDPAALSKARQVSQSECLECASTNTQ